MKPFLTTSLLSSLTRAFDGVMRGLARQSVAGEQFRQVEDLRKLSDTQLAARGLKRNGIAQRVFVEHRLAF
ncbi:hypothetical protein [Poseidonocella sedimentorum]|uniref:DUF1127 domain-containing protein n=1 Tax=Poseidonocella sedimentorum TaxID=871652 RepID=A0A1I6CN20_9RHOB|nr:hypothetical protein [Poseidonocella sedimentorum]SFQ94572.1 hypothetical protein SAMN04515673_10152 [Poseidonocella sedimentorum]